MILQTKRGPSAHTPKLADGEFCLQTDAGKVLIGNGGENIGVAMDTDLIAAKDEINSAMAGKAPASHTHTAEQVGARPNNWVPNKADVGLGNVDNTPDAQKSVNYANSAVNAQNADAVDGVHFHPYDASHVDNNASPSLYAFNPGDDVNCYVKPASLLSVNYANSANYANTAGNANALGGIGAGDFYRSGNKPYIIGSYSGDGSNMRKINVGFRPQYIVIIAGDGNSYGSTFDGNTLISVYANSREYLAACAFSADGVTITPENASGANYILNVAGEVYRYAAFR